MMLPTTQPQAGCSYSYAGTSYAGFAGLAEDDETIRFYTNGDMFTYVKPGVALFDGITIQIGDAVVPFGESNVCETLPTQ
jgi:hypothetical protein